MKKDVDENADEVVDFFERHKNCGAAFSSQHDSDWILALFVFPARKKKNVARVRERERCRERKSTAAATKSCKRVGASQKKPRFAAWLA